MIKEFLNNFSHLGQSLSHFSRLGKVASRRSFLNRERRKLISKLGEKTLGLLQQGKLDLPELLALSRPLEKLDALLREADYGGKQGVAFRPSASKSKKISRKKNRRAKKNSTPS